MPPKSPVSYFTCSVLCVFHTLPSKAYSAFQYLACSITGFAMHCAPSGSGIFSYIVFTRISVKTAYKGIKNTHHFPSRGLSLKMRHLLKMHYHSRDIYEEQVERSSNSNLTSPLQQQPDRETAKRQASCANNACTFTAKPCCNFTRSLRYNLRVCFTPGTGSNKNKISYHGSPIFHVAFSIQERLTLREC